MVRNDDAVGAGRHRKHRILPTFEAFDHDLHRCDVLQTVDEVPFQRRARKGEILHVEAVIHGLGRVLAARTVT
jgi:hypothetical protein